MKPESAAAHNTRCHVTSPAMAAVRQRGRNHEPPRAGRDPGAERFTRRNTRAHGAYDDRVEHAPGDEDRRGAGYPQRPCQPTVVKEAARNRDDTRDLQPERPWNKLRALQRAADEAGKHVVRDAHDEQRHEAEDLHVPVRPDRRSRQHAEAPRSREAREVDHAKRGAPREGEQQRANEERDEDARWGCHDRDSTCSVSSSAKPSTSTWPFGTWCFFTP